MSFSVNKKQMLKLLAPYFAVGVCWCVLSNGWLTILAYHAQILFWSRNSISGIRCPDSRQIMLIALPAAAVGPALYFLLPYITHTDLSVWLSTHHLSGLSLTVMIPYFGIIHPLLEQLHWTQLRESSPAFHPIFAGYHILVLYSLLAIPWLILCFVVLTATSVIWQQMAKRTNGLSVPVAAHVLADLGIIIAAWLKA